MDTIITLAAKCIQYGKLGAKVAFYVGLQMIKVARPEISKQYELHKHLLSESETQRIASKMRGTASAIESSTQSATKKIQELKKKDDKKKWCAIQYKFHNVMLIYLQLFNKILFVPFLIIVFV